ncbi:LysR family transcriptional regulator, partial [Klebsiella aerogenes]
ADIGVDQTLWLVMHSDLAHSRRVRVVADHLIALFDEIKDQLTSP